MATSCVARTLTKVTFPRCGQIDLFLEEMAREMKVNMFKLWKGILKTAACTGEVNSRQITQRGTYVIVNLGKRVRVV